MSAEWGDRFAEPNQTKSVPLGPCRCPGTPHAEGDKADVRTSIGSSEAKSAYGAGVRYHADGTAYWDEAVGDDTAIARFTTWWNLVDKKRKPIPIDARTVSLLDVPTRALLLDPINAVLVALQPDRPPADADDEPPEDPLPNASGEPSAGSPPRKRSSGPTSAPAT
jgi:hypothetical protein